MASLATKAESRALIGFGAARGYGNRPASLAVTLSGTLRFKVIGLPHGFQFVMCER